MTQPSTHTNVQWTPKSSQPTQPVNAVFVGAPIHCRARLSSADKAAPIHESGLCHCASPARPRGAAKDRQHLERRNEQHALGTRTKSSERRREHHDENAHVQRRKQRTRRRSWELKGRVVAQQTRPSLSSKLKLPGERARSEHPRNAYLQQRESSSTRAQVRDRRRRCTVHVSVGSGERLILTRA